MVNIFIIVPDIYKTASLLDQKRLCKQRLEARQIINILESYDKTGIFLKAWSSHPATRTWIGYTNHLKVYFNIICREWIKRGFKQTMELYNIDESPYNIVPINFDGRSISFDQSMVNQYSFPIWISFYPFYMSHQASLCRKDPKFYKFLLREEIKPFLNNGYLWPSKVSSECYYNWNFSYHDHLGCGSPAVYKINSREVLEWIKNKNINPKTNKSIRTNSDIYKDYINAMDGHNIRISNNIIYFENNILCYINNIDYGIQLFTQYINSIGGYPDACSIVYRKAN
jgi:hypothetical protein